jgi:hypothetical protein
MSTVNEQALLEELHQVPRDRWTEVLTFIRSLQPVEHRTSGVTPICAGVDLAGSDLIGIWADREDIQDSREFARDLRRRAEKRSEATDAAGHRRDG